MARATPRVEDATLIDPADTARAIVIGTPTWYAWLDGAITFAFVGVSGRFTAHKARRGVAKGTGRHSASAPGWCGAPISARVPISAWSGCRLRRRRSRILRFLRQHPPDQVPLARRPA